MVFYLPTQVGALVGDSVGLVVGLFTAIPWICALLAAYFIPAFSDRTGERRKTAAVTILISGCGIALSVALSTPAIAFIALCFAAAGFIAVQPVFWTFPSAYLTGSAAAAGIALINTIGAIGAFLAPNLKNWAETTYASNSAGLYLLASLTVVAALLLLAVRRSDSADYAAAKTHLS